MMKIYKACSVVLANILHSAVAQLVAFHRLEATVILSSVFGVTSFTFD